MNDSLASPDSPAELRRFPFWGYSDLLLFFGLAVAAVVVMIIGLRVVLTLLPGWSPGTTHTKATKTPAPAAPCSQTASHPTPWP